MKLSVHMVDACNERLSTVLISGALICFSTEENKYDGCLSLSADANSQLIDFYSCKIFSLQTLVAFLIDFIFVFFFSIV